MSGTAAARTAVAAQLHKPRYIFERNLRWVEPYSFTFRANAKLRWVGRSLRDVFSAEFRDRPASYFDLAVAKRAVSLNGCTVESLDSKIGTVLFAVVSHHVHPTQTARE
jgi:hypothetical protein